MKILCFYTQTIQKGNTEENWINSPICNSYKNNYYKIQIKKWKTCTDDFIDGSLNCTFVPNRNTKQAMCILNFLLATFNKEIKTDG